MKKNDDDFILFAALYEEEYKKTPLTQSEQGKDCLGNGLHENIECCCDECESFLFCFPQYKNIENCIEISDKI